MEYVTLNNGVKMPILEFGVYQIPKEDCERCVLDAISVGYRHIGTAQSYLNEQQVENAITKCGIPREELFITTKVWIDNYGYEKCKKSVLESMRKLQVNYIDLVLLHQPFGDYYGAHRALEDLYEERKIIPQVNQIETNVFNQQIEAQENMKKYNVVMEACAPFGEGRNNMFSNETLKSIGDKYGKSIAQVILR